MKIKYWMTKDPVTIEPDASIADAARLMKERGFRRLPVVENGFLVGLVTYRQILEAQPSSVSTLSRQEARYLLAKLTVRDVMRKDPVTVSPEDDVLTALMEGNRLGLGCYPVMVGNSLVGIITSTDLFNLIVQALGADNRSDYIYLAEKGGLSDHPDRLSRLLSLLAGHGIAMMSFMAFPRKAVLEARKGESVSLASGDLSSPVNFFQVGTVVLLKVSTGRRQEAVEVLKAAGYTLLE